MSAHHDLCDPENRTIHPLPTASTCASVQPNFGGPITVLLSLCEPRFRDLESHACRTCNYTTIKCCKHIR